MIEHRVYMLICLDISWRSYILNSKVWDSHQESHKWLMTSRERLWHSGADVVFARLGWVRVGFSLYYGACRFSSCVLGRLRRFYSTRGKRCFEAKGQRQTTGHVGYTILMKGFPIYDWKS